MLGPLIRDKEDEEKDTEQESKKGPVDKKYEDLLDDGSEHPPVVKVIEVVATSPASFDDAIARGVKTAAHRLRHITGADVRHMTVAVRNGKISEYRVDLKIAFALDEEDEEGED